MKYTNTVPCAVKRCQLRVVLLIVDIDWQILREKHVGVIRHNQVLHGLLFFFLSFVNVLLIPALGISCANSLFFLGLVFCDVRITEFMPGSGGARL